MDVLNELRALVARRAEHVNAIEQIDREMAEVRRLVGVSTDTLVSPRVSPRRRTWTGNGSSTRQRILDALAVREPQTVRELRVIGTTIGQILPRLVEDGTLDLERVHSGGRPHYTYWRMTPERRAMRAVERADEEAALAVEAESG